MAQVYTSNGAFLPGNKSIAEAITLVGPTGLSEGSRLRDILGRTKVSIHQNIYDADFEYGDQPLRWERVIAGGGTIQHLPGAGGVRMTIGTASGDLTIRQSRPYHRYQPGKTMFMATAINFGTAQTNQRQRVGMFDDGNGIFFEQADPTSTNPFGMFVVIRSDAGGVPSDTRISYENWSGDAAFRATLDWTRIQMIFVEYAWYGAGALRWGVYFNGEPYILHQFGTGNAVGQTSPWARTGNLPARYEQRNIGTVAATNNMIHYGVSVIIEGGQDDQRGGTYSYGMAIGTPRRTVAAASTRFPVLSVRMRTMGVIEYTQASGAITGGSTTTATMSGTPFSGVNLAGRSVFFPGLGGGNGLTARIISSTSNSITFADNVTGAALGTAVGASQAYQIGIINRGQLLPRRLLISASQLAQCEIIASVPTSPISLTGVSWAALSTLGSFNSLAERDVSSTALSGGEVVMKFTLPAGGSGLQDLDLSQLFPLYTNVRGNVPDILTVAVSTQSGVASDVGVDMICQEAMS